MNFLFPDKNNFILNIYHKSSKFILPLSILYLIPDYPPYILKKSYDFLFLSNLSFHSYVSSSCLITDYIKIARINHSLRFLNLNLHVISLIGYTKHL